MARGIAAVVFMIALIFSMTIIGGLGIYASMGVNVDVSGQNADVQHAAEQLDGIEFAEGRSSSILQGPLAVVMPVIRVLQVFTAVIGNTSGILQLLYGLPKVAADTIELMFRIAMLVTITFLIRGAVA
jgi:hypothetical protein